MRQKLGLDPHKDTKILLQELREQEGPINKLTKHEIKELTMKGGPQVFEQGNPDWFADEGYLADRVGGLGTEVERPVANSSKKQL